MKGCALKASSTRYAGAILPKNMALVGLPFPALSAITAFPAFMFLVSGIRLTRYDRVGKLIPLAINLFAPFQDAPFK